jgi:hypothetical protein
MGRVYLREAGRQRREDLIRHAPDRPQWMIVAHALLG